MNFFEKNLELFKSKIPMLYETVVNEKPIFSIELQPVNNEINYVMLRDEKKCFIHSIFDINEEMYQMFKTVDKNVETLIIFGLGCGYALKYIKNNYKNVKNILIIEPSLEIFKKSIESCDIFDEMKSNNITFIVNKNVIASTSLLFEYIKDKMAQGIKIVFNISYRTIFGEYYEIINKTLTDCISKIRINLNANNYYRKQWTYNPLINMRSQGVLVNNLFGKFSGKSAIIVSAGPSLNKNIHLLKYVQDKALIASVGTASKILESNNIKPHFRFAMDSNKTEKLIFENLEEDNSILVYSDRVQHEIPPLFKRRLKMILDADNLTKYVYNKAEIEFETLPSGFSIANTALDTLIKFGFTNIIFIGQDMCFTKDKLYANGSWVKDNEIDADTDGYIKVKDMYGNEVYTDEGFIGVKSIFEMSIIRNQNINFINASEGGLGINGTKIKTFKQVLDEDLLNEYNFDSVLNDLFNQNNNEDDFEKILKTLCNFECDIDKIIKINDERIKGLKKIDKYLNKGIQMKRIERDIVYLNKYEEELRQLDLYNDCIKLIMDDIYKVLLNKFKYEGGDAKEAILNSKNVLECISYELKEYLLYFKKCINEK